MKTMVLIVTVTLVLGMMGCATGRHTGPPPRYDFFAASEPDDPSWKLRVNAWQAARHNDLVQEHEVPADGTELASAYASFSERLRFDIVVETVKWVQLYGAFYYQTDTGRDIWPTLRQVLEAGVDDCDGMDLLTFELLRRLGFEKGEIYRTVFHHQPTERYHMVTLWFPAGPDDDPYVLDPTGDVSRVVKRLSLVREWQPLRIFDETASFPVVKAGARSTAQR